MLFVGLAGSIRIVKNRDLSTGDLKTLFSRPKFTFYGYYFFLRLTDKIVQFLSLAAKFLARFKANG